MTSARKLLACLALLLATSSVQAQQLPPNYLGRVGGVDNEVCVLPTITSGSAYAAGNSIGGLIVLPNSFLTANSGALQSVRLTIKSTQTAEFDIVFFSAQPSTVFADKTTPALVASDAFLAQPVIKLTNSFSGLGGNTTIFGADNINRGVQEVGSAAFALITTPGTPTFASTSDLQLCASWADD
jgi:hypothetical protein